MDNGWSKIILALGIPMAWLGSFEWRLRGKVDQKFCKEVSDTLKEDIKEIKADVKQILTKL